MSHITPTGGTPNFGTPNVSSAGTSALHSTGGSTSSTLSTSQTGQDDFNTLLQFLNKLPPGQISLFDYFAAISNPENELIAQAKIVDLQTADIRKAFHEAGVIQFTAIFNYFNTLFNSYLNDSSQFTGLTSASNSFDSSTVPAFESAQNEFNTNTEGTVSNKPWEGYNAAVTQFYTNLSNGMPYSQAAAIYNTAVQTYNGQAASYNQQVQSYNSAVGSYNSGLNNLQGAIDQANATIVALNIEKAQENEPLFYTSYFR